MTLGEAVALAQKTPEVLAQLAGVALTFSVAIGGLGTGLEQLGETLGQLWLERLGQRLEAIGTDIPKVLRGSRYTADIVARVEAGLKRSGGAS